MVGAEYQRRLKVAARELAAARAASCEDPGLSEGLQNAWDLLQSVEVDKRQARFRDSTPIGQGDHQIDDWVGDVRDWISKRGSCHSPNVLVRPYGERTRLFDEIAETFSQRWGIRISRRRVKACVEVYRKFLKDRARQT